ncbi:1-acyl-sn-glycerol-3-phosphate acyltransferase [Gramella sp. AN32]|uniref:1-acyl-sn-glycerol-3-phosphate acyltransferase n=1 Tax=Christiangramia antarctica TaxID=2058158 RepID=A0ABW5XBU9_9FLAO|nr:1-acyl-sn-glycerol-3-phosphate acyltransferase [Gramella sp. AN32]MCM4157396.1 acyltransferase [Gramella sp. AN32]
MHKITGFIFYRILGWRLKGKISKFVKKCVVIVAPHTSSFDFFMGLMVRNLLQVPIDWIGKKELFKPPFGWYFKWTGGNPLDRAGKKQKVDSIASMFSNKETFRLALSPEGTREKTLTWKTGFYYIALKAEVPLIMVSFDYGTKTVKVSEPFYPEGNFEKDFGVIKKFYAGVLGKNPHKF